ncbi:MAG: hypothetical protein REI93_11645, partial [Pedobacter sp.]|nr:hypothetical protein [Pedobacter sp.]
MFSCGLFKNTKTKKELDRIDTKEQMNFQHAAEENSSLMQSLDFKTRDSSETFSMLEFIPNGPISFDESTGLKFQASWARLYT